MTLMDSAFALVIGIADYMYINKLPQAVAKGARDIYELLIDQQHCGYSQNKVQLLLDSQATQAAIL